MSIFDLHASVVQDYRDFVRSFFTIADDRARQFVDRVLNEENRLWPDALLQVSPSYQRARTVDALADDGRLERETAQIARRCCEPCWISSAASSPSPAVSCRRPNSNSFAGGPGSC